MNIKPLFDLFSSLTEKFLSNATRTLAILTFVVNEQWDELAEFVKTKFLGKFIDHGTVIILTKPTATLIQGLLDELEAALIEKDIPLYRYDNGKFYHPNTLTVFPDAKIPETLRTLQLLTFPDGGMTEGEMIAEAGTINLNHKHFLAETILAATILVRSGHFRKGDTDKCNIGFLEELFNGWSAKAEFGLGIDNRFFFFVNKAKVIESNRWDAGHGILLSNNA